MHDFLGGELGSLAPSRGVLFGPGNIYMRSHNPTQQNFYPVAQGSGFPAHNQGGAYQPVPPEPMVNPGPQVLPFPQEGTIYWPLGFFPQKPQIIPSGPIPQQSNFGAIYFPPTIWNADWNPGNPLAIYQGG